MTELAIGPANYAGQAHAWAQAAGTHLGVRAVSFTYRRAPRGVSPKNPFLFQTDLKLPYPRTATRFHRARQIALLSKFSHVMLDGFVTVGQKANSPIDRDVELLEKHETQVALISHGSDIRHPEEHRALFQDSYFNYADAEWSQQIQEKVERNQATLQAFPNAPLFVSTPDLLLHQPHASWLPLTGDPSLFKFLSTKKAQNAKPTFLHIPSRRNPPIKGTQFIDPVLKSLDSEGIINYISPESVSRETMLRLISTADVVVDQLLSGAYGMTAVEAMAMGKVVIGNVSPDVRALMPAAPPIVQSGASSFPQVVEQLLAGRETWDDIGEESSKFAQLWHDGRAAADALRAWLL